eukprot:TRINITY_DN339_c0_g1_i2.p1 TRINITY_DN339_c0_g1~~TRINITY_DN339_c0_g1_i2.p1  ORF type:complete len:657 (-),score=90.60 TRINITY_DN339_c0_g1_i2:324-2294(-)
MSMATRGDKVWSGVDNIAQLTSLKEEEVVHMLSTRYSSQNIYTYAGSILIAMNPYTKLPRLYDVSMMKQYKGGQFGELSPHVFAVADASYRAMMNEFRSQSILVRGERGAGKTYTTKLIMLYLTYVGGRAAGVGLKFLQKVLASYPVLEAFGNAKTVGNDNSSRFAKLIETQFDENGRISGAEIRTYLLERSRVVQVTDMERNYHCFYQLCAFAEDAKKYKLDDPTKFRYLNLSKTHEFDEVSSPEEYLRTRKAMDIVGINLADQKAIFRILAAILHLGNINFSSGKEYGSSTIEDREYRSPLQISADLFICDANLLLETLCTQSIWTRQGSIVKALDSTEAVARRDALAMTLYARLFDWLVKKINLSVGQDRDSRRQISILDIFGFECFKTNSFEQFCINFANEKLQQHFIEHVLKKEQDEYIREEINCNYIEIADNQDVLDLIEKPLGIIALLDEVCMLPKSTAATFSTKLFQNFQLHPRLEKAKLSETDFTVSHYARKVTYQTDSFLDKNRDFVAMEFCKLFSSSKCVFLVGLFPMLPEESPRSPFSSVATKFQQELNELMDTLNLTNPHYIHCLKPNSLNCTDKSENEVLIQQLKSGGVLEAARISLQGKLTCRKENIDVIQIQINWKMNWLQIQLRTLEVDASTPIWCILL